MKLGFTENLHTKNYFLLFFTFRLIFQISFCPLNFISSFLNDLIECFSHSFLYPIWNQSLRSNNLPHFDTCVYSLVCKRTFFAPIESFVIFFMYCAYFLSKFFSLFTFQICSALEPGFSFCLFCISSICFASCLTILILFAPFILRNITLQCLFSSFLSPQTFD